LARTKRAEASARLRQVQQLIKRKEGTASVAEVLASPLIQGLRGQEAEVLRKVAELSQEYGRKHPRLINIRSELKNIRRKIAAEVDRVVQGLKNEASVARTRERSLLSSIGQLKKRVSALNRNDVKLRALEREAKANRTLYENFLSRFKELSKQNDIHQADARIVSYAARPSDPSYPKTMMFMGLAFVGSMFAGIGIAGLLERFDVGFRSMQEVEQQAEVPALGLIPALGRSVRDPAEFILNTPHSAYSESMRSLFTSLHLSDVDNPPKIVLLTSSVPEEGKTLTAISLARLVAMTGKKVILIDGDLRRSAVHRTLGLKPTPGLVEVLSGQSTIDQALQVSSTSGLYVLVAGNQPANPVDLLSSQNFKNLLDGLRSEADFVVIDSPPLAAVSDARMLAALADKTVFIVRWASTRRETVLMSVRQLRAAGADLAGVILSRVDIARHASYGYGDSGYYHGSSKKYYTEPMRPPSAPSPPPPPRDSA
jgi:capsular exopolysaccharide synthesis family protein